MLENKEKIAEHKRRNREMFDAIAQRYDVLNHLLSGGIDIYWRRRALDSLQLFDEPRILDLATGTADFALAAGRLNPERIIGVDVALEMLRLGVKKVEERRAPAALMGGDAENLPFQDASFDVVMGAFGVRNFGHIPSGLAEAFRVFRPGGQILVLDFCEPAVPLFKQLYLSLLSQYLAVDRWPSFGTATGLRLPATLGRQLSAGKRLRAVAQRCGLCRVLCHDADDGYLQHISGA